MNTLLHDRGKVSQHSFNQGRLVVEFDSDGIAKHPFKVGAGGSEDLSGLLKQFKSIHEVGRPGIATAISDDLSAESEITVPAGKFWRVIGGFLQYTASSDVATRVPVVTLEDDDGNAYATITMSTKTADQVENDHFLAGSDGNVSGNEAVAATASLTIAADVTAGDTMTIDGVVYTFVASDDGTVTNAIEMGADHDETQANVEAKLVDGQHPTVNAEAFTADVMVLTARTPGAAGNSIALSETFTSGSNGFSGSNLSGGVDAADNILSLDFPDAGVVLEGGEVIALNVTDGHANDAAELAIFYLEFDNDPRL